MRYQLPLTAFHGGLSGSLRRVHDPSLLSPIVSLTELTKKSPPASLFEWSHDEPGKVDKGMTICHPGWRNVPKIVEKSWKNHGGLFCYIMYAWLADSCHHLATETCPCIHKVTGRQHLGYVSYLKREKLGSNSSMGNPYLLTSPTISRAHLCPQHQVQHLP
jgi:hypothetical protein